jgi:hypothetical protein
LTLFVAGTLFAGAWWGFPVQDDNYLVRLIRMEGPHSIASRHPDRPVCGILMELCALAAGEHKAIYIAIAILSWLWLAAAAAGLWRALFPEWTRASTAVALATLAPIVTRIQFTTLTTVFPVVVPVVLVLTALVLLLRGPEAGGYGNKISASLMVAGAIVMSEYGLATTIAATALVLVLRRWRSSLSLLGGAALGYLVFRAISNVAIREATDPDVQIEQFLRNPWTYPLKVLSSVWYCTIGAWARAASEVALDWSSKSTLLAVLAGLMVAAVAVLLFGKQRDPESVDGFRRRFLALVAAVIAGRLPAAIVMGWPAIKIYPSRVLLPIVAFASCASVALILVVTTSKYRRLALCGFFFLAAYQLVVRAFEQRTLQVELERFGENLRPHMRSGGLVVVIVPDRLELMQVEILKATRKWSAGEANRLWVERPGDALRFLGPRSGCRSLESIRLETLPLRWPLPHEKISRVLWAPSSSDKDALEPYFSGCAKR